ncbi:MAG: hypothetical protein QNK32_09720 [Porticoccus sp.]|nr:hypothetical protein [Porticoccus sp.]
MNTNAQVMGWIKGEYSKYKGFNPGVVTGGAQNQARSYLADTLRRTIATEDRQGEEKLEPE